MYLHFEVKIPEGEHADTAGLGDTVGRDTRPYTANLKNSVEGPDPVGSVSFY